MWRIRERSPCLEREKMSKALTRRRSLEGALPRAVRPFTKGRSSEFCRHPAHGMAWLAQQAGYRGEHKDPVGILLRALELITPALLSIRLDKT